MTEKKKTTKKKSRRKKKDLSEEITVSGETAAMAKTGESDPAAEKRPESPPSPPVVEAQPMPSVGSFRVAALNWAKSILALPNDSPKKTLIVAVALCLVCSVVVSSAAVLLRPLQLENAALDRKRNIVEVAGLLGSDGDVDTAFERVESRVVDLETGEFAKDIDPARYDQRKAARDPARSVALSADNDIASISRRARYATVYLVRDGNAIQQIILPVHGYGLWSTLYGFLALRGDFQTVAGLKFYAHAETPGLGGEVDNPSWRQKWDGKIAFDDSGKAIIEVIKGVVDASRPDAQHQVDGLAGATLTTRGVDNLLKFWLGENGFGPFLARMRNKEA